MKKIKKIELSSFRAYEDKKIFDFTNDRFDDISNLVVLYAPNGSGKTSFFDAVEWGFTGEIKRINGNKFVKDIADIDKEHILKNKESSSEYGTIKIELDDNQILKLHTQKVNKSRLTDNKPGKIIKNFETIDTQKLKLIGQKNILTHDQIDKFLRFQNSEERYEALSVFWDSEGLSNNYTKLLLAVKEIEQVEKRVNKNIVNLQLELEKMVIDLEINSKVNYQINKYIGLKGNYYNDLGSLSELNDIYYKSIEILEWNKHEIIKEYKKIENAKQLKDNFNQVTVDSKIKLIDIANKISAITNQHQYYLKIKKLVENLNNLDIKSNKINEEIIKLKYILENSEYFQKNLKIIEEAENEIKLIIKKMEKEDINIKKIVTDNQEYQKKVQNSKNDIEKIKQINRDIEDISFYKTKERSLLEKKYDNELLVKENILKTTNILSFESRIKTLVEYSLYDDEQILTLVNTEEELFVNSKKEISGFSIQFHVVTSLKDKLSDKNKELTIFKKFSNDLDNLKQLGYGIINNTHTNKCPLCNKQHENFDELMLAIHNSSEQLISSENLMEQLYDIENKLKLEEELLNKSKKNIIEKIRIEIQDTEKKLSENKKQQVELKTKMILISEEVKKDETSLKLLKEKSNIFKIDTSLEENKFYNILENIQNQQKILLSNSKKNYLELKMKLEENLEKHEELVNKIELRNIEVKSLRSKIENHKKDSFYKKYAELLIGYPKNDIGNIGILLRKNENKNTEIHDEVRTLEKEKINLTKLVQYDSEIDILEEKRKLESQKEKIDKENLEFENRSKELFGKLLEKNSDYDSFILVCKDKVNLLEDEQSILINLSGMTKNFMKDSEYANKKAELSKLENQKDMIIVKFREMKKLKNKQFTYIKYMIEKYFNLDIVNQIFKLIEPHPEFTEVNFKIIDNKYSDKLGLNITCKKKNSTQESPILYLSSAQINVLSLSIFLATAIGNTDDLSTILMDDPIQHLDSLNELSFIDLLRIISFSLDKQIILSTHSQQFFDLCKRKLNDNYHLSKFIDLSKNM